MFSRPSSLTTGKRASFRDLFVLGYLICLASCSPPGATSTPSSEDRVGGASSMAAWQDREGTSRVSELRKSATTQEAEHIVSIAKEDPPADAAPSREPSTSLAPVASEEEREVVEMAEEGDPKLAAAEPGELGRVLYLRHCVACHGEQGDGQGIAARFVFPKPRDLRAGRYRLVSTDNNIPTDEDLRNMLIRGMPGSSMPPWAHLSDEELNALVAEIRRLRREGLKEQYVRQLIEDDGFTEEELGDVEMQTEIEEYANEYMVPGAETEVPEFTLPDVEDFARGREVYVQYGCLPCHGNEGKGDGVQNMFDAEEFPTAARDFTMGIFKGGHDEASLYRRIAYGMPGTPMPASQQMTPQQMIDVVHYLRSLSTEESRQAAILNRTTISAGRVEQIPESAEAEAWEGIPSVSVRMTPLWWRDRAILQVHVRSVHDGEHVAFQLSWDDPTQDDRSTVTEGFRDACAIQLYRGDEPFLGMGAADASMEVWFWDSDRQLASDVSDQYPRMVVDMYPWSEERVNTAEFARPGTRRDAQPDISLPSVVSGNLMTPSRAGEGGSRLAGLGPGSTTFRPRTSQFVRAEGGWKAGTWRVLITRPLQLPVEDNGLSLEPGEHLSISFAVWDGSAQDRDGKKLITIWQDLILE